MLKKSVRRVRMGKVLVRELVYVIKKITGSRLRWEAMKESGIITVGKHTYGKPDVYAWDQKTKLNIGNYCSIAEGVTFILGGEHRLDWVSTFPFNVKYEQWPSAKAIVGHPATKGDIILGSDVWLGHGVLVLSGVKIGNGAIVGAGAVVTKDVPDFAIVGGSPARFIKWRFDEDTRIRLTEMAWWDWSEEKISKNVNFLMSKP